MTGRCALHITPALQALIVSPREQRERISRARDEWYPKPRRLVLDIRASSPPLVARPAPARAPAAKPAEPRQDITFVSATAFALLPPARGADSDMILDWALKEYRRRRIGSDGYEKAGTAIEVLVRAFKVDRITVTGPSRTPPLVHHRQMMFAFIHIVCGTSTPRIGALFGGRDHSTVLYGINKYRSLVDQVVAANPSEGEQ